MLLSMISNAPSVYYAQNIQTGNFVDAQSTVQTNIQGSGSVSTHIEVSANGERKVLDSNSPGTYKLEVNSSNNNSTANNQTVISHVASASSSSTPIIKTKIHKLSFLSNFGKDIQNFLRSVFNAFKFK